MPLGNSSYLQIPLMAENDNQKYLLFNNAIQRLDESLNRLLALNFTAVNITLTESQLVNYGFFRGFGHTIPRTLSIPTTVGTAPAVTTNRFFIFDNTGTDSITIQHTGAPGATVVVPAGSATLVYADGTDITAVASATGFDMQVDEEGVTQQTNPTFMDFQGNNVTVAANGLGVDVAIAGPDVRDEGVSQAADPTFINFTGAGVTASVDASGVIVNIPGGAAGIDFQLNGVTQSVAAVIANFLGNNASVVDVGGVPQITYVAPEIQDEGASAQTDPTFINFIGTGVTATPSGNGIDVNIPGAAAGIDFEDNGVSIVSAATVADFVGNNVSVADAAGDAQITINAPAIQDESVQVQTDPTFLNFIGGGVTATVNGNGIDITIPGGGGGSAIQVDDDGAVVVPAADRLNFTGPGVTVSPSGTTAVVNIPQAEIVTQDDGANVVTGTDTLNFTGSGVFVTNPSGNTTEINIPGASGIGLSNVEVISQIDFSGSPQPQFDVADLDQYDEVIVIVRNVNNGGNQLRLRMSTNNGASFDSIAGNYPYRFDGASNGTSATQTYFELSPLLVSDPQSCVFRLSGMSQAVPTTFSVNTFEGSGFEAHGFFDQAVITNAFRLYHSAGTPFTTGQVYVLGVRYATEGLTPWKGARLSLTANQSIPDGTPTAISWSGLDRQVGTFFNPSQPTRLTVPPGGINKVILRANVHMTDVDEEVLVRIYRNGSPFRGGGASDALNAGNENVNLVSDVIDVTAGDYFEVFVEQNNVAVSALDIIGDIDTWFSIEAVEQAVADATLTTPVAFHAYDDAGQAAGVQIMPLETLDEGGDYDVGTGVFTAPVSGIYHFYGAAAIAGGAAAGNTYIRVNGVRRSRGHSFISAGTSNDTHPVSLTIRLSVGDTVDFETDFATAAGVVGEAWNYFGGYLINASTGNAALTIRTEPGTSRSNSADDDNAYIVFSAATTITYTIEPDSTYTADIGTTITAEQNGTGQIVFTPGAGVTLNSASTLTSRARYSVVTLTKVGANEWTVTGDVSP